MEFIGIGDFVSLPISSLGEGQSLREISSFFLLLLRHLPPSRFPGRYIWYWSTAEVVTFLFTFSSAMAESRKQLLSASCSSLVCFILFLGVEGSWDFCNLDIFFLKYSN